MLNKILLVEDQLSTSNYTYQILEKLDCKIMAQASSSQEAIQLAKDLKPNLVLLDINLKDRDDGIETASEILSFIDIPIVYITSKSDENTIRRIKEAEPNAFIIKPFDEKILKSALEIAVYRHQVKKELLKTKELLRSTIESIDDTLISFDIKGNIEYLHTNDFKNIPFIISESPLKKNFQDVFSKKISKLLSISFNNLFKTQKAQSFEFELKSKNTSRWYLSKASLRKDPDTNESVGVTLLVTNITAQKNMEKELIRNSEKLAEAQEVAQLGSCEINFKKNTLSHNDIFFELLDIEDYEEIISYNDRRIINTIHPDDKTRYLKSLKEAFSKKNENFSMDFRIIDKKNNIRYIHFVSKIFYSKYSEPNIILITIQDVSWQKESQKLWKDIFTMRKSAEIKEEFFQNTSHQLKTPLTDIVGILDLLNNTELNEQQKQYIATLKESSGTIINMINDILDVSKIEAGKMKLNYEKYNIRKNVKNIINNVSHIAKEKNITVNYDIDETIPDFIIIDGKRVNQVISNLLSNGLNYTNKGHVTIRIKAEESNDEHVIIYCEIKDTGIGIIKKDHKNLFKAFQKSNKTENSSIGSGIGLYICKNIVNLLGGDIGVESEKKKGSTFWFTFKAEKHNENHELNEPEIHNNEYKDTINKNELNLSVLLVEDKKDNQKVLTMMLESLGCKVTIAPDGQKALELYQENVINAFNIFGNVEYDLILMDLFMPVMDGVSATKEFRSKYKELPPIIGISAHDIDKSFQELHKLDFDDFITKPISVSSLENLLYKWKNRVNKNNDSNISGTEDIFIENLDNKVPIVNENTMNNILKQADGNVVKIRNVLNSFIKDMDDHYEKFNNALKNNEQEAIKNIILTVKGISATIGASRVHEISIRIEKYVTQNQLDQAKKLFKIMIEKYNEFKKYVDKIYL